MEVQFNIFSIKANGIENSSSLNIGTILQIGFSSNVHEINGNGKISGDHGGLPSLFSCVDDRDLIDTPIWHHEFSRFPY